MLSKGSAHKVDAQKLTASLNTDKSRFLTLCYASATMLDGLTVLMQARITGALVPRKQVAIRRRRHRSMTARRSSDEATSRFG